MTDSFINQDKVYFSPGNQCGTIEWDKNWKCWHFVPKEGCRFSADWLKDIAKSIDKL